MDDTGRTVPRETAGKGAEVSLQYVVTPHELVISSVVVHRAAPNTIVGRTTDTDDSDEPTPRVQQPRMIARPDPTFAGGRDLLVEKPARTLPARTFIIRNNPRPSARREFTLFDRIFRPRVEPRIATTDLLRGAFNEIE
jgi:hypothetical protein